MGKNTTDDLGDLWVPAHLLVPWSSRVGFSKSVCGLPSQEGCWRHRRCNVLGNTNALGRLVKLAVASSRGTSRPRRSAWLVFLRPAEPASAAVEQHFSRSGDEVDELWKRPGYHSVVLELDRSGSDLRPYSYSCRAWNGKDHQEISDWRDRQNDQAPPSLFQCFGKELFRARDLSSVRKDLRASIADLIQSFLDRECREFRVHGRGAHFGVSWCHLDLYLQERSVNERALGREKTREERRHDAGGAPFSINDYLITFSLINPSSLRLEHLEEPHVLNLDTEGDFRELRRSISGALPLWATPNGVERSAESVCYADCLTTRSREQLLAAEIDNSFLRISVPEITVYLLDWLLARVLAVGDLHGKVAHHLHRLVEMDDELVPAMEALLECDVRLDPDPRLFDPTELTTLDRDSKALLGAFPDVVPFGSILKAVDLQRGGVPLLEVVRFLSRKFREDGYRDLPMFSDLGWRTDRRLAETDWEQVEGAALCLDGVSRPRALEVLARVIRTIAREHVSLTAEHAEARSRRLTSRSVFPIAHLLTHWPPQKGVHTYYVFPIWESLIGDEYRPSIFAHVFSAYRPLGPEGPRDSCLAEAQEGDSSEGTSHGHAAREQLAGEEAQFLLRQLLPFGRLIAQSTYDDQLRRSQVESRLAAAAYSIGHPMKRRVDSVHATLNSMLDLKPNADTEALIHDAGRAALRVSRLGHVLDVLSDVLKSSEVKEIFQKKKEWRSEETLPLVDLVKPMDGACLAPGTWPVRSPLTASIESTGIGCWLRDQDDRLYRPADLFYEELVYELFLNAAKHGKPDGDRVPVEVSCREVTVRDGPVRAVTLANGIEPCDETSESPWQIWNEKGDAPVGGLYFLTGLLHRAGLGRLWTRRALRRGAPIFLVALELNGLESIR